jgi:hypothetical protein
MDPNIREKSAELQIAHRREYFIQDQEQEKLAELPKRKKRDCE